VHKSEVGEITARWKRENGKIESVVKIPSGIKLQVKFPGVDKFMDKAGIYNFSQE
jgi:hypothetical protein